MAANDYYGGYAPTQSFTSHDDRPWTRQPGPPAGVSHNPSPSPSPIAEYPDPYNPRPSRYSTASYDHGYPAGGRLHGSNDQYTDDIPLKNNATPVGGRSDWMDADTHYPPGSPDPHQSVPLNDPGRKKKKKKSNRFFKKKVPWVVHLTSIVQVIVFIVELVKNAQFTGSPIMTQPNFNPMIGPSPYVQVNMGARFVPCMRNVKGIQDSTKPVVVPCPSTTSTDLEKEENQCTLSELCGFEGVPDPKPFGSLDDQPEPNQWFRFIIPMFLHAGIIHIAFNLFAMLTLGVDMERTIGWWRFAIVYFASGIMGFVFGANFDSGGISSGASGCLFGVLAICLLDLLYRWKSRERPMLELIIMVVTILVSFVLGLLPGLDNFSHIGGFLTGIVLGVCLLRSPDTLRERIGGSSPYTTMTPGGGDDNDSHNLVKEPLGFFKGRKPLWWVWWLLRAGMLVAILTTFIVLLNNFYKYRTECSWCKYLSCMPVRDWCELGTFTTEEVKGSHTNGPAPQS